MLLTENMVGEGDAGVVIAAASAAMQVAICAMIDWSGRTYMFKVACYIVKCLIRAALFTPVARFFLLMQIKGRQIK